MSGCVKYCQERRVLTARSRVNTAPDLGGGQRRERGGQGVMEILTGVTKDSLPIIIF